MKIAYINIWNKWIPYLLFSDENECLTGKHNCLITAGEPQCNDTLKGFVCQCRIGFTGPTCIGKKVHLI